MFARGLIDKLVGRRGEQPASHEHGDAKQTQ
jgi:hypothetical protein